MNTISKMCSIKSLYLYYFSKPEYHRDYVWDKKMVLRFFEDIKKAYEINKKDEYYLGILTVKALDKTNYVLIDGYQRLITILLLLIAMKDYIKLNLLIEMINEIILGYDTTTESKKPRLKSPLDDEISFLISLLKETKYTDFKTISIRKMDDAYQVLKEGLEKFNKDFIHEFTCFIIWNVTMTILIISDYNDLKIYETLNRND